ncbi:MAG: ABC transporter ATP-binding protein [Patescibacteria group bacterium]
MRNFLRVIKVASVYKKLTFLLIFFSMVAITFDLVQPQIIKLFFDLVEKQIKGNLPFYQVSNQFWLYIILFAIVITAQAVFNQFDNYVGSVWYNKTRTKLISNVFSHVTTLSLSFFEKNPAGKIKERADRGTEELLDTAEGIYYEILPQIVYILIAMYFLFSVSLYFGLILFVGVPLFVLVSIVFMHKLNEYQDNYRTSEETSSSIVVETLVNIKTVKSFVTEIKHAQDLKKQLGISQDNSIKRSYAWVKMNIYRYAIVNTAQILILGVGVYWVLNNKITLGAFSLAWAYTNRSFSPLWYLTRVVDRIQKNLRSVRRTFEILDTLPEIKDNQRAKNLKITEGKIDIKHLSFGYNNDDNMVLKDFDLTVPNNKSIAFVGKSGVGKSTIIKLLLRFYDPNKGDILIDGQNIKDVTQKSLRESIGVVMQDSSLFNDTALNNISYGNTKAKKVDVIRASKMANAHDFIMKLPQGYDTVVGERGVKLSGGEQQRINIARTILKNPPILILDEATSSLDSESEKLIQDALWNLIRGRTTIIIAHRLSTVMRADLIVVMDKGKISEMDTHKQLVKNNGIYSKLFKIQSGGYLQ